MGIFEMAKSYFDGFPFEMILRYILVIFEIWYIWVIFEMSHWSHWAHHCSIPLPQWCNNGCTPVVHPASLHEDDDEHPPILHPQWSHVLHHCHILLFLLLHLLFLLFVLLCICISHLQAHGQAALMGRTSRQARLANNSNSKVNLVAIMLTKPTIPTITKATKATKGISVRVIIRRKARCRPTGLGQE